VAAAAPLIDAADVPFVLSAWIGGYYTHPDRAQVTASFLDAASNRLAAAIIGPVTLDERAQVTGLWYREARGSVPRGTRSVEMAVDFIREQGNVCDGYVDNISLVLGSDAPSVLITNVAMEGGAPVLRWWADRSNLLYAVEGTTDLVAGTWAPCAPTSQWWISGAAWTNATPVGDRGFYRVRAVEP
jgi:hypothetical protein